MKKLITLVCMTLTVINSFSQISKIDSLKEALRANSSINNQTVTDYLAIGHLYGWDNPDSAIANYNRAYWLSKKLNFAEGKFLSQSARAPIFAILRLDSAAVSAARICWEGLGQTVSPRITRTNRSFLMIRSTVRAMRRV